MRPGALRSIELAATPPACGRARILPVDGKPASSTGLPAFRALLSTRAPRQRVELEVEMGGSWTCAPDFSENPSRNAAGFLEFSLGGSPQGSALWAKRARGSAQYRGELPFGRALSSDFTGPTPQAFMRPLRC